MKNNNEAKEFKAFVNGLYDQLNNPNFTYDEYYAKQNEIVCQIFVSLIRREEITWNVLEIALSRIGRNNTCVFMSRLCAMAHSKLTTEAYTKGVMYAATMKEMYCSEMKPLFKNKKFDSSLYNDTKAHLPKEVVLYRGCSANEVSKGKFGFSWTTDKEVAQWFAQRTSMFSGKDTVICTCKANVDDIIAYVDNRNEKECIFLKPKDVKVCDKVLYSDVKAA